MSGAMEENLAENLRLSEDPHIRGFVNDIFQLFGKSRSDDWGFENEEDGLDAQRSIEDGKELDRIVSQLESKVVEKESVIESLENDLKTLKTRFEATNEELKLLEEEKEELEQQLDTSNQDLKKHASENVKLSTMLENKSLELEKLSGLKNNFSSVNEEKLKLEQKEALLNQEISVLKNKLGLLEQEAKSSAEASFAEEKLQEALKVMDDLENEVFSLNEQIETRENSISDLRESVSRLTERT